jgi:hypothetical protein
MKSNDLARICSGAALAVALASGCAVDSGNAADEVARHEQPIINGTVPSPGGLAGYGVVSLPYPGCTGQLLDNLHVITAHHCVRQYNGSTGTWGALYPPPDLKYEDGGINQTAGTAQIFEPAPPWSLGSLDYSLIALSVPFVVGGSGTGYSRAIYPSADSTLANQNVLCIGYGGTVGATSTTFASGFGTLTSATLKISGTGSGVLSHSPNASGQVGFGGDSGSSCFLSGYLLGIQSTCAASATFDVNGNGVIDGWFESAASSACWSSAPSQFRSWAATQLGVTVDTSFAYSAALAAAVI